MQHHARQDQVVTRQIVENARVARDGRDIRIFGPELAQHGRRGVERGDLRFRPLLQRETDDMAGAGAEVENVAGRLPDRGRRAKNQGAGDLALDRRG